MIDYQEHCLTTAKVMGSVDTTFHKTGHIHFSTVTSGN